MKRVFLGLGAVAIVGVVLLLAAFLSLGGWQMITAMRGPVLPTQGDAPTPAGDLAYLRAAVLANEHGATAKQLAAFTAVVDAAPPPQSADDLTLAASRALASFDNAHTTLMSPVMHRLPIRLHWTSDALIVVKARPEQAGLVGRRVLSLGGKAPEAMLTLMPQLVGGGTANWVRYRSEYFYSAPAALACLGAEVHDGSVELRTIDIAGAAETVTLAADAEPLPGDPFWDFRNAFPGDTHFRTEGWVTLLRSGQQLPLYLQETNKLYLLRDLPEQRAVYVRMNGSIDDESETVAAFTQRALSGVSRSSPQNIVVDFRYNRGGDYTQVLPLVKGLAHAVPANGHLYLIVGANTFSAGLLAGSQFKHYLANRMTVVGGEVGDILRFRGEGMIVTLPATHAEAYLGTAWDDAAADCGWFGDCWPPNKFLLHGVGSLDPDIRIENSWESYRTGRDLLMEAVFADIKRRTSR